MQVMIQEYALSKLGDRALSEESPGSIGHGAG